MNGDNSERLPQEGECRNEEEYGILERASAFSQRVLEEIETLAGTTACKSVQLLRLKKWAQECDGGTVPQSHLYCVFLLRSYQEQTAEAECYSNL